MNVITTELCTFPDDDKDYCKVFEVPTDWLTDIIERLDGFNEQLGTSLSQFLEEYCWDETYFIYLQAKKEKKLLKEAEQK